MSKAKQKGTAFETMVTRWLAPRLAPALVKRAALSGAKDTGDIHINYIRPEGAPVFIIVECKAYARIYPKLLQDFIRQTHTERINARAMLGVLVIKAQGIGAQHLGETPAVLCYPGREIHTNLERAARVIQSHIEEGARP